MFVFGLCVCVCVCACCWRLSSLAVAVSDCVFVGFGGDDYGDRLLQLGRQICDFTLHFHRRMFDLCGWWCDVFGVVAVVV